MKVLLAKEVRSQIDRIPFKSVKVLKRVLNQMKQKTFDQSYSRSLYVKGKTLKEVRVGELDLFYYQKEDNIFIVSLQMSC